MARIQTRARAVDMLGRQQIAGIQNALSELFKNAHDAYADDVKVDYFENSGEAGEGFLIVRDNGVGMTLRDFVDKWLVLGTESKAGPGREQFRPADKKPRPITGEKGIGRLAIALLGRQTFILTRAERSDGLHDLVVGLVHWGLFEIPGLNLDEIEIPVLTVDGGRIPNERELSELRQQLKECALKIAATHVDAPIAQIVDEIDGFQPDLESLYEFLEASEDKHLALTGDVSGTHFLIGPSNPTIATELEIENAEGDYSFRRQLLGFSDQVFRDGAVERVATSFRRWKPGDLVGEELLDTTTFFTREELLKKADHLLVGKVDEHGQFSGALRVYDQSYDQLLVPWADSLGKQTLCGPFDVTFGYLMGRPSESFLEPEEFKKLNEKLDHVGGMYVYRDDIRILPYGDYAIDWLEVEKRRSKGAGYYFFSARRMFGAVLLTRSANGELQEKAGREGFQQNDAYRQLRGILVNLLTYLAAEFFRKDSANAELFEKTQAEVRRRSAALERRQKQSNTKRRTFVSKLASFSDDVAAGLPASEIASLRRVTRSRMDAASKIFDQDKAAAALVRAENEAVSALNALRERYTRKRPTGVALGKDLQHGWDAYQVERTRLDAELFKPFQEEVAETLGAVAAQARVYIDQRKRLEERIKALGAERKKDLAEASRQANATASDTRQTVFAITERARLALDETIRSIQVDLNRTDLGTMEPKKIEEMRQRWEEQLADIEGRHRSALMAARDMLASLAENLRSSDGEEPAQVMEALESRMLALEEQADEDFEMVQLGLAVAIINHEFAASIKRIRQSVQELGQISRRTEALRPVYDSIRSNFEHLDGHLNLFTPLQRRLYRVKQTINGASIRTYATDLFSNRFERHKINLVCTDEFMAKTVECFPSTLYPAIINIIDNALFWLNEKSGPRTIELDADGESILISNNGPPVEERDMARIFERGFSRKVGGRGLGLFISAKALQSEGMSLEVLFPPKLDFSVTFKISVPSKEYLN